MSVIKYGETEIETTKLPEASVQALLRRGLSHYLGNEMSSKVVGKVAGHIKSAKEAWGKANEGATADDVTEASFEPSDEVKAAWKAEALAEGLKALAEGTIGNQVRGPRLDPLETAKLDIVKKEIFAILDANKLARPKKAEDVVVFGDGTSKSLQQMIDNRFANHGDRIAREAEKKVAEDARRLAKAKSEAASRVANGPVTATDLGL